TINHNPGNAFHVEDKVCILYKVIYILKESIRYESDWAGLDEDEDAHVWEDNWDDDNVEDDFSNQLRAELEKHGYKMETS
uniref:26S proteasome complex subunit SEM1 n=1 Tax=Felis catus TaxID=9685 RepID=A0ABI7WCP1_FELCA